MRVISIGSALTARVIYRRDGCVLRVSGTINDSIEGRKILDAVRGDVVFDMGEVPRITSFGVKEWMSTLRQLKPRYVGFVRCKPAIVSQFNTITGFGCGGQLVSLYAPYICTGCGEETEALFDLRRDAALVENFSPPDRRCESCGARTEFDDVPETYFSFCSGTGAPTPPPHVEQLIDDPSAPEADDVSPAAPASDVALADRAEAQLGHYKLVRRLGSGGMAEVFLAQRLGPGGPDRNVALKRILPSHTTDATFIRMFEQEARLAARLSHPNIVQVYEHGKAGDQHFIAMEFVRGWDLGQLLTATRQRGAWVPVDLACFIVAQVCAGLAAAHEHRDESGRLTPIVHRDVSPHNVLISEAGVIKLTDFGIAKGWDVSGDTTDPGAVKGKLPYLSPELLTRRDQGPDPRQDIYAAGLLLYDCLVHDQPFLREGSVSTMMAVLWTSPQRPSERRAEVPPALDEIVMRSIHRAPETRYPSARALGEALEQFMLRHGMHTRSHDLAEWLRASLDRASMVLGDVPASGVSLSPSPL